LGYNKNEDKVMMINDVKDVEYDLGEIIKEKKDEYGKSIKDK
jgi:hypothetical protein